MCLLAELCLTFETPWTVACSSPVGEPQGGTRRLPRRSWLCSRAGGGARVTAGPKRPHLSVCPGQGLHFQSLSCQIILPRPLCGHSFSPFGLGTLMPQRGCPHLPHLRGPGTIWSNLNMVESRKKSSFFCVSRGSQGLRSPLESRRGSLGAP